MADKVEFDPKDVERCALEEFRCADEIEKKTKFPHDWFAQFVPATGPVCKPVHEAVHRFFVEMEQCGKHQAAERRRCGGNLLAFNRDMQFTDEDGGAAIANAGPSRPANFTEYFLSRHGVGQPGAETS